MKLSKKLVSVAFAAVLALTMSACSASKQTIDTSTELGKAIDSSASFVYKKLGNSPKFGSEESVIALIQSDYITVWDDRAANYVENMKTYISRGGNKIAKNGTIYFDKYPIVFMAHTAAGIYADKTGSADLTQGLTVDAIVTMGGVDNKINCLTALESGGQGVYGYYNTDTQKSDLSREILADYILGLQNADGSFTYAEMSEKGYNTVKVTSDAVVALASTKQTSKTQSAVKAGADYIEKNVKTSDSLEDLIYAVIALNYADRDASEYVNEIISRQYSDGSYSLTEGDKKGNLADTAKALLALASQSRFVNDKTKLYDFSDVYGMAHNKLSPLWTAYVNIMKYRLVFIITFIIFLYIRAQFRIKKWKEQGLFNERTNRMYTDAELEEIRKQKELKELEHLEKVKAINAEYEEESQPEQSENSESKTEE